MKKFATLLLLLSMTLAGFAQIIDPVKWTFKVNDLSETESELVFTAQLENGWHLYSQHTDPNGPLAIYFDFKESADYKLVGGVKEPKPHEEMDDVFNCIVRSFSGKVTFRQKIVRLSKKDFKVSGIFGYQLCNDGSCIAPEDRDFTFSVKGAAAPVDEAAVAAVVQQEQDSEEAVAALETPVAAPDTTVAAAAPEAAKSEKKDRSLLGIFLWALLGGIVTMFTPCVFPMIPMTVNFFMNSTDDKRKSRRQAWAFGFSIVFLFAILGAIL